MAPVASQDTAETAKRAQRGACVVHVHNQYKTTMVCKVTVMVVACSAKPGTDRIRFGRARVSAKACGPCRKGKALPGLAIPYSAQLSQTDMQRARHGIMRVK